MDVWATTGAQLVDDNWIVLGHVVISLFSSCFSSLVKLHCQTALGVYSLACKMTVLKHATTAVGMEWSVFLLGSWGKPSGLQYSRDPGDCGSCNVLDLFKNTLVIRIQASKMAVSGAQSTP